MTHATDPALILVVEDENALRDDIVEELQEAGYRTIAAKDGNEALALLRHHTPDLLLCDITMPGLDGYGLLRSLRGQLPEFDTAPFVFLTALSEPQEVVEGKLLGADDYLVKPVDYDLMLATIGARLRQVDLIRRRHHTELAPLRQALAGLSGGGAEAALDLIALGVILLDGRGSPVHVNRAAHDMTAAGDLVHIGADGIRADDAVSDRELRRAVAATLEAAGAGGERIVGVMLQPADDGRAVSVLACALPQKGAASLDAPHVAVFLSAPDRRRPASEALLAELFGLTPTEARVAAALARSTRAADVAEELGVSQTTIAFHMRNLFQKTGTNRQADLIGLILAGPMMIQSG